MARNRLIYLAALVGATVFYGFFYAWFSEFLLILLLALPVLSLVVSIPAMLTMQLHLQAPQQTGRGNAVKLRLWTTCPLPQPMCRFFLTVHNPLTGFRQRRKIRPSALHMVMELPTEHSGQIVCQVSRCKVYDYLGLFCFPRRWMEESWTDIAPAPIPPEPMPDLQQLLAVTYRAKAGGGFSEIHELRDYRPGDSLRQVHWKLTAKTDRPIVREPQVPVRRDVVLTLDLNGKEEEIDNILDQTCYLSTWLLEHQVAHQVRWFSGQSVKQITLAAEPDQKKLIMELCRSRPTAAGMTARCFSAGADWHYHVENCPAGAKTDELP